MAWVEVGGGRQDIGGDRHPKSGIPSGGGGGRGRGHSTRGGNGHPSESFPSGGGRGEGRGGGTVTPPLSRVHPRGRRRRGQRNNATTSAATNVDGARVDEIAWSSQIAERADQLDNRQRCVQGGGTSTQEGGEEAGGEEGRGRRRGEASKCNNDEERTGTAYDESGLTGGTTK